MLAVAGPISEDAQKLKKLKHFYVNSNKLTGLSVCRFFIIIITGCDFVMFFAARVRRRLCFLGVQHLFPSQQQRALLAQHRVEIQDSPSRFRRVGSLSRSTSIRLHRQRGVDRGLHSAHPLLAASLVGAVQQSCGGFQPKEDDVVQFHSKFV